MDNLSIIGSIISIVIGGGLFAGITSFIRKLAKAAVELTQLIKLLRSRISDPELKKEADDATEAVAEVLEHLKLRSLAKVLRDAF